MAYTTINKHTDYFNTKIWTGTGSSGAKGVTGVGFQPDFLWIKNRSAGQEHWVADAVRGTTKFLESDTSDAESSDGATGLASFDSDGFTLGTGSNRTNQDGSNMVAWNWKAGTTGSGTTTGSCTGKAYSYSVNTTSGFSIVTYKGNGSAGHTIPHHLGATPSFIIVKNMDAAQAWLVGTTVLGWTKNLHLNEDGAVETSSSIWNDTAPSSTVFTVGTNSKCNTDDANYIAYCFTEKTGYSKFGAYTHNGGSGDTGTFVNLGFKPSFLMIKNTSASSTDWMIQDTTRSPINEVDDCLFPNEASAESVNFNIRFLSNGFKLSGSGPTMGSSGNVVIYAAFGQSLVGSNDIPSTGR